MLVVFLLLPAALAAEELLQTTTTWEGGEIAYPQGKAEITSAKLVIEKGKTTAFHCHPVPTMGYVLHGQVEVETSSGKRLLLGEGDSVVEVMRTLHRGTAVDGPVEILVFYAGSEATPNTVLPADDPGGKYCDTAGS